MLPQQIPPKIAIKIPPHAVYVIGVVLDLVVFDQKGFALDAVVVAGVWGGGSGPAETDFSEFLFFDAVPSLAGFGGGHGG